MSVIVLKIISYSVLSIVIGSDLIVSSNLCVNVKPYTQDGKLVNNASDLVSNLL